MSALTLGPAVMFTPADRPERYATALERADAVILDLEDAVTPDARPTARDAVAAAWAGRATGGVDGGPLDEDCADRAAGAAAEAARAGVYVR